MGDLEERARFLFALKQAGVEDKRILKAMENIPRSEFLQGIFRDRASEDMPLPISCGQTISAPSIVGLMTQALEITPKCKILEIGTGSGYQSAILAKLARRVYSIERHGRLASEAEARLIALGLNNVTIIKGDGSLGLSHQAPFDRILLTAAAEDTPASLLAQLRLGGIMVLPVGQSDAVQKLIRVRKEKSGLAYEEISEVRFVPLLPGTE